MTFPANIIPDSQDNVEWAEYDLDNYDDVQPYSRPGEAEACRREMLSLAIAEYDAIVADLTTDAGLRFDAIRRAARKVEGCYEDLKNEMSPVYTGALVHW